MGTSCSSCFPASSNAGPGRNAVKTSYMRLRERGWRLPRPPTPDHGGNAIVPPAKWALTGTQLDSFLGEWTRFLLELGLEEQHSGKDFCKGCVKPWTERTGCSVALLMNSCPKEADIMLSHAWGENMFEVREILSSSLADMSLSVWFCICALYQPEDGFGPSIDAQVQMEPFSSVIEAVKSRSNKMMVLHTSTAEVYIRLWCVFEIDYALRLGLDVEPQLSRTYERVLDVELPRLAANRLSNRLANRCRSSALNGQEPFLWVDTELAVCSRPEDTRMIRRSVERSGGFKRLDNVIREHRERLCKKRGIKFEVDFAMRFEEACAIL